MKAEANCLREGREQTEWSRNKRGKKARNKLNIQCLGFWNQSSAGELGWFSQKNTPLQVWDPEFRLPGLTIMDCFSGGVFIGMQASPAYQQKLLSLEARLWETTGILWYSTPISSIWWGFVIVFLSPSLLTLFCSLGHLDLGFLWGHSFHMVLLFSFLAALLCIWRNIRRVPISHCLAFGGEDVHQGVS